MAKFVFNDPTIHLDIAGHEFDMPVTPRLGDKMKTAGAEIDKIGKMKKSDAEKEKMALAICKASLDGMLGVGAFDAIFTERTPNVVDAIAVINFIAAELKANNKARV